MVSRTFFARSTLSGEPLMKHLQGSLSKSTSILVLVWFCISLTCDPFNPITMPIFARGISTKSDPACLFCVLSISSMINALAFFTASAVPATLTMHGSEVWSRASTLNAPLFSRISMMVCACLPMTLPNSALGTGMNSSTAGSRKMGTSSGGPVSGATLSPQPSKSPPPPRPPLPRLPPQPPPAPPRLGRGCMDLPPASSPGGGGNG
mmetsp:Transcript_23912/g.60867  ORF Transcript_23912/g.60867 Transcript_23912/m.60867 type:complete len:207 (+) Transcript_23912:479-1099(+)